MKKKAFIIAGVALVLVIVAIAAFLYGIGGGGSSIEGGKYTKALVLTAKGGRGTSSGSIFVSEGETVHLEYALKRGRLDVAFSKPEQDFYSVSDLKGTGQEDFEDMEGDYTVFFTVRGAVGEATVRVGD